MVGAPPKNELQAVLDEIKADGIRTIVNALIVDPTALLAVALQNKMTGNVANAEGYLWIGPDYNIWDEFPGSPAVYAGLLSSVLPTGGVRKDKIESFSEQYRSFVPHVELSKILGKGMFLSMEQASSPGGCLRLSTAAYDSVARVRLALESADLSKPATRIDGGSWWGSEVRQALESPGVAMQGLIQGPDLRKSAGPGLPWGENTAAFAIVNYAGSGQEPLELYEISGESVSEVAADAANLPGGVGFSPSSGHLVDNACNGGGTMCLNQGQCTLQPGGPGTSPGWCKCTESFVGRFCHIRGDLLLPPSIVCSGEKVSQGQEQTMCVHVGTDVEVLAFGGLANDGDTFSVEMKISLTWKDPRFPLNAGEYSDAAASEILGDTWHPKVVVSGISQKDVTTILNVVRDPTETLADGEKDVTLTLEMRKRVTQDFVANFRRFPFDDHELRLSLRAALPEVRLDLVSDRGKLVSDKSLEKWNPQWPPTDKEGKWAYLSTTDNGFDESKSLNVHLNVMRAYDLAVFRLIFPSLVMVVVSWGGFWIKPGALMPRFASGFISFLALQGFKTMATNLMPKKGQISGVSWIDIYISAVGILMGLSVVETIVSQYVNEHYSKMVGVSMDFAARGGFPFTFILVLAILSIEPLDLDVMLYLVHLTLLLFTICFYGYVAYEAHYLPWFFFIRVLDDPDSSAEAHKAVAIGENEFELIFDMLDRLPAPKTATQSSHNSPGTSKHKKKGLIHSKKTGQVHVETFVKWLQRVKPRLETYDDKTRAIVVAALGPDEFSFPAFKKALAPLITQLTVMLYHEGEDGPGRDTLIEMNRQGPLLPADEVEQGDPENDDEEDLEGNNQKLQASSAENLPRDVAVQELVHRAKPSPAALSQQKANGDKFVTRI
eukprot:gnl/TRDRNA2_/TRDRNA2_167271_c5_seq5.p1 gnl/TRDRNA2_/TRDRNA2_167271_c5~~gnl/TRDRNA2_/TRDRNA2_167271_c5_seq5.p1  ORF type:complete len:1006 (+),score=156.47 gnl/TRDRNA2_/TRDRNA2_167271_c5_seq5:351-3020(+)